MKIIKHLPIDGRVKVCLDRRWVNGVYGEKTWRGVDRIISGTESLCTEIMSVMKFVEKFDPEDDNDSDAPTANYGDIDPEVEYAYVIKDEDKPVDNWRKEHTYERLCDAIEKVVGDLPSRGTYKIKNGNQSTSYYDDFKDVVEVVYNYPNCSIEGLNLEEEEYVDQIKQYLVLLELKK